jgi:four helix bundle protein
VRRPYLVAQLAASVDSIGANIAEGYGRLSGRERARFYEFALASAREAREWYRRVTPPLSDIEASQRRALLSRIIKILTVAIPQERAGSSESRIARRSRARRK